MHKAVQCDYCTMRLLSKEAFPSEKHAQIDFFLFSIGNYHIRLTPWTKDAKDKRLFRQ